MGSKSLAINLGMGIFVIVLWMFVISPELKATNDLLELNAENTGFIQVADYVGAPLSDPIKMQFYWIKTITEEMGKEVMIHTVYDYRDVNTGESFWTVELDELVDKKTKKYSEKSGFFAFPPNVEKRDYDVYDVGGSVMPYKFQGVKEIDGLIVYVFSGTVVFDISSEYPDFDEPIFEEYSSTNHIEPITGIDVSFREQFTDYAIIDDKKIPVLDAWDESTQFSESVLIKKARDLIILYSIYDTVIPSIIILFVFAIVIATEIILKLRKNLIFQQQIRLENDRMITIGELSARIAHDIRNPLNVIKMSNILIKNSINDSSKIEKSLIRSNRAIIRITRQVEGIMGFLKESELKLELISVHKLLNSVISEMDIPLGIEIKLPKNDIQIQCDVLQIHSLFDNLITNAIQSINDNGIIILRLSESNDMISVEIENDGPNIPENMLNYIFDPLFTTKQKGTGLGLASCANIVKQHNGTISVKNNPVRFLVTLPVNTKLT